MKPLHESVNQIPESAVIGLAFSGGKDSMACLHLLRDRLSFAIFVDTGFTLPETLECVTYARALVPMHVVRTDRKGQNAREGIPADVVPIDYTSFGQQFTGRKPVTIQSYRQCHFENVNKPLWDKAISLSVTHLVSGSRADEHKNAMTQAVMPFEEMTQLCPIHDWSEQDVLDYLETVMEVPAHYYAVPQSSSLDCFDCTAFVQETTEFIPWLREHYPERYAQYAIRNNALYSAIQDALGLPVPEPPAAPIVESLA
ncbi:protein of unknown function [Nitrospira japonica]|uniref:Phosphoadenosine phosphosulphate reductase domain-containing protein n=1 Tax=Nitrospira japonica TaxID=1325564 RepID=A0A1W1I1R8_9BACT|nr:phosphoadenosine phosphosulfate reductase family protein [Nitrospira japonica]SLM46773.1 protein of unknown function [Nitrospira japonica]